MLEQPRRFLERGMFRKIVDPVPRDDEFAALAVDETQLRRRRDDSVQSTARHTANVAPMYDAVNVD